MFSNTTGFNNTAIGLNSIFNNTIGHSNVSVGLDGMYYNTTGNYNTGLGRAASCASGTAPNNFTALGYNAGYVGSSSNSIEIGNTSVSWIGGQSGWSTYSDRRIKDNIQNNVPGLEFINKLNPVTYTLNIHRQNEICGIPDTTQWEGKYDIEQIVQSGFIAQEVEAAAQAVNYDFIGVQAPHGNGKLYSMQYAALVVPLTKAVQELSAENAALKQEMAEMKTLLNNVLTQINVSEESQD